MSLVHYFLSPHGRICRQEFWLGLIVLMAVTTPVSLMLDPEASLASKQPTPPAATLWNLLLTWPSAAISIKRFNDRNWPQWIGWLLALAMAGMIVANHQGYLLDADALSPAEKLPFSVLVVFFVWALIENGFYRGTIGPNRYGPDPLGGVPRKT